MDSSKKEYLEKKIVSTINERPSIYAHMLLSEHYKLTIGDDKFVDYFTFPTKKEGNEFCRDCCNVGYWWLDKCVVGCHTCVKNNGWTWGKWNIPYTEITIDIPCNGVFVMPDDFPGEENEMTNLETILEISENVIHDNNDCLWKDIFDKLPDRLCILICDSLNIWMDYRYIRNDKVNINHIIYLRYLYDKYIEKQNNNSNSNKSLCMDALTEIDNMSTKMPESTYLALCNILKKVYTNSDY